MSLQGVTARRLDADLAHLQADGRLPSVVAVVVRDGGTCWTGGRGEVPGPAADVQYRIGSVTKTITAVALLGLAERGDLDLDAPLSRWLPDAPYAEVGLAALLGHGAGLPAEPAGEWWERAGRSDDLASLLAAQTGQAMPHASGTTFHYSNLGYGLLGAVVAEVGGGTWWEVVSEQVLQPLGMTRTTYGPEAPTAQGWSVDPYAGTLLAEPTPDTGAMAAAGQLWSTVGDLARWAAFLLAGDDLVLPASALAAAYAPQTGHGAFGPGSRHGLGFQLVDGGAAGLVGHAGSMPGFVASCFVDPVRRAGAVLLANATTGLAPVAAADRLLGTLEASEPALAEPWRPTRSVPDAVAPMLGVWHWGARPQVWSLAGETLVVHEAGRRLHRFAVAEDGRVVGTEGYFAGEDVELRHGGDGTPFLEVGTHRLTREPYPPGDVVPGGRTAR